MDYIDFFRDLSVRVLNNMNMIFIRKIIKEEVKEAVFLIKFDSVFGVDGMLGFFF